MSFRSLSILSLSALILVVGACSVACGRGSQRVRRIALLGSLWSEEPLDRRLAIATIDLRGDVSDLLGGADGPGAVRADDGLEVSVPSERFRLEILGGHHASSTVRVRLRAEAPGRVELRWRPGGHKGQRWRSVNHHLRPTGSFDDYLFDLERATVVAPHGFDLELHLSAGDDEVGEAPTVGARLATIQTIDFVAAPGAGDASTWVGKARLGRETRESVVVPVGGEIRLPLPPGARRIELAVGRRAGVPEEGILTVTAMPSGLVVLERTLGAREVERWVSLEASLEATTGDRELRFGFRAAGVASVSAAGPNRTGVALVANPAVAVAESERRPDVILLSMDTVGTAEFGAALREGRVPHLARIARRGVRFTEARASSTVTSTSHAVLLTGRLPGRSGVLRGESGSVAEGSLAERLREAGCSTTAFTGGVLVTERLGHDRGFEVFTREDTLYRSAFEQSDIDVIGERFASWLESPSEGCRFLFLHTYEAHGPYLSSPGGSATPSVAYSLRNVAGRLPFAPERLSELITVADLDGSRSRIPEPGEARRALEEARAAHRAEISRIDRVVGPLLERALARRNANGTIVVVTADHGEAFFEHGLVEHTLLEESNLRIPLILAGRGVGVAFEEGAIARSVDVAPTILALAGLEPGRDLDGRNLLDRSGRPLPGGGRSYSFTNNSGFVWEVGGWRWVTPTVLKNENFGSGWTVRPGTGEVEERRSRRGFEAPSEEAARYARTILSDLPGLHVDLSALAGRVVEIDPAPAIPGSALHGWDLEPIGEHEHGVKRRSVRVGDDGRLWILLDRIRKRGLDLIDVASGETCRLDATTPWGDAEATSPVCAAEPWTGLRLSRGRRPVTGREGTEPGEEESRRLRALGYIG